MVKQVPREEIDTNLLDPRDSRIVHPQRIAVSCQGVIATAHYQATEAGNALLAAGGNAVDAAVAAAFALGVCEPAASGLGGQTIVMLHDAVSRRKIVLDGSSRAPHRIEPGKLTKSALLRGHTASTVPSTPATLAYMLERYGTKSLAQVLEPSIQLAEQGYRISPLQHYLSKRELKHLRAGSAAPFFLRDGNRMYAVGERFRQPVLASTLKQLAKAGIEDFYQGEIARKIHQDMVEHDGFIRDDDLAQIPWPVERRPISTRLGAMRLFTVGPPGAGRTLIEVLNVLEQLTSNPLDPDSPKGALLLAETLRRANVDRVDRPFEPNLYPQELELGKDIIKPDYARVVARRIHRRLKVHGETTHLSAMDAQGNTVALTQSIERVYGAFAAAPDLGFLYNNYMSAFEYRDITHPYYLRPNAVPWASVAPTIVFKGRNPWLSIGSPGSERIVSAVVQVLWRLLLGYKPLDAVHAPRLHCSNKGKVSMEAPRMRNDIPDLLRERGFELDLRDPYSFYLGCVQLVMREKRNQLIGVADPRRDGSAGGPR